MLPLSMIIVREIRVRSWSILPRLYVYIYITGWWFQPLWKILVSWDDYSQYMEEKNHVPNHQPELGMSIISMGIRYYLFIFLAGGLLQEGCSSLDLRRQRVRFSQPWWDHQTGQTRWLPTLRKFPIKRIHLNDWKPETSLRNYRKLATYNPS